MSKIVLTVTIGLRFPESTCVDSERKVFLLSMNDAKKSEFLSNMLDTEEFSQEYCYEYVHDTQNVSCKNNVSDYDKYYEFIVPPSLYKYARYCDVKYFMDLWKGKEAMHSYSLQDNYRYDYKTIAKLSQAFTLDESLEFTRILNEKYHPYTV